MLGGLGRRQLGLGGRQPPAVRGRFDRSERGLPGPGIHGGGGELRRDGCDGCTVEIAFDRRDRDDGPTGRGAPAHQEAGGQDGGGFHRPAVQSSWTLVGPSSTGVATTRSSLPLPSLAAAP